MFQPSPAEVRRFFCDVLARTRSSGPGGQALSLSPMEDLARQWVAEHPEYHADLADAEQAIQRRYGVDDGQANPFLHLSMHLSLSEQCSIDQPQGIRQAVELLTARLGDLHEAHHVAMECLGTMLWESQRSGRPPDGAAYVEAVQRRATAD